MTSLVIPLAPSPVPNQLLARSVESALRALPELQPILIGQPHLWDLGRVIHYEQNSADPVTNTTAMLEVACYSPMVSDPFVWSNDDIFWRRRVALLDVYRAGFTARRFLAETPMDPVYGARAARTVDALIKLGRPQWDYERHVPLLVHKDYMRNALRQHREGAIRSFYGNLYHDDPFGLEPDVKAFDDADLTDVLARDPAWFSTADDVPLEAIERALELAWV